MTTLRLTAYLLAGVAACAALLFAAARVERPSAVALRAAAVLAIPGLPLLLSLLVCAAGGPCGT